MAKNDFLKGLLEVTGNMIQHKADAQKERVQFQALMVQNALKNKMEMEQKRQERESDPEYQMKMDFYNKYKAEQSGEGAQPSADPSVAGAGTTTLQAAPGGVSAPSSQPKAMPFGGDVNRFANSMRPTMRGGKVVLDRPSAEEIHNFLARKQEAMPEAFDANDKALYTGLNKKLYGVEEVTPSGVEGIVRLPSDATPEQVKAQKEQIYSKLDPTEAALVDDVANYRVDASQLTSRMGKNRGKYYALASLVNPGFDSTKYAERAALRKDFASGNTSKKIDNLNTAINHLVGMYQAAEALDNTKIRAYNGVRNYIRREAGDPVVDNFNSYNNALSGEMANIFKATGATDPEIQSLKKNMDASNSPEQLKSVLKNYIHLMAGRSKPIESRWSSRTGTKPDFDIVYPESKEALKNIGLDYDQMMSGEGARSLSGVGTEGKMSGPGVDAEYQAYLKAINGGR